MYIICYVYVQVKLYCKCRYKSHRTLYLSLLSRPYDFMVRALAPVVERMGVRLTADCQHRGFFPTGGG